MIGGQVAADRMRLSDQERTEEARKFDSNRNCGKSAGGATMQQINGIAIANTTTLVAANIATVAGAGLAHRGLKSRFMPSKGMFKGCSPKSGPSPSSHGSYRRCYEEQVLPVEVGRLVRGGSSLGNRRDVYCTSDPTTPITPPRPTGWQRNDWQQTSNALDTALGLRRANRG